MRRFTLVQELACAAADAWRYPIDDDFDRRQYLDAFGFAGYELLERRESDTEIVRRIRIVPTLHLPTVVARLVRSRFTLVDEQHFDKRTSVFSSRSTPSTLAERISISTVARAEIAGPVTCRRVCEIAVEARLPGVGVVVERTLEDHLRAGWESSASFLNAHLACDVASRVPTPS